MLGGKATKSFNRLGSRTESAQGDGDSADRDTIRRREMWSEEAVLGEGIVPENIDTMGRKNREKVEDREEVEEIAPQPLVTASSGGGGNDMLLLMQMWIEESKRKDETWRTEMRVQREEAREREERAKHREERLLEKMQAQIEATTRPVTVKTRKESLNLPRLTAESSLDTFVATFEAQLNMATVPETDWKLKLVGQLDECH